MHMSQRWLTDMSGWRVQTVGIEVILEYLVFGELLAKVSVFWSLRFATACEPLLAKHHCVLLGSAEICLKDKSTLPQLY